MTGLGLCTDLCGCVNKPIGSQQELNFETELYHCTAHCDELIVSYAQLHCVVLDKSISKKDSRHVQAII